MALVSSALDCQKYAKHAKQVVVDVKEYVGEGRHSQMVMNRKVFDLPERLLSDFSSLRNKLSSLEDDVAKAIKDKKSSKSFIDIFNLFG